MLGEVRTLLHTHLHSAWRKTTWLTLVLVPVTFFYWIAITVRHFLYRVGLYQVRRVNSLVLVVGNAILGGAGKTPTVIELVNHLRGRGLSIGVISRGYGRSSSKCLEVSNSSSFREIGDEPKLIYALTQVPVFVAQTRFEGASALLKKYPDTQIVICDDGLQHYSLFRDLEVCVFDNRGTGNGWLFPSGPLREPWPRRMLRESGQSDDHTLVLHTGTQPAFEGFRAKRTLSPYGKRCNGDLVDLRGLVAATNKPLMGVAGIAQPESFFSMLGELGLQLQAKLGLSDHDNFEDFDPVAHRAFQILCTEKDATKLWSLVPDAIAVALIQEADSNFYKLLDTKISTLLAHKKNHHGHKTA